MTDIASIRIQYRKLICPCGHFSLPYVPHRGFSAFKWRLLGLVMMLRRNFMRLIDVRRAADLRGANSASLLRSAAIPDRVETTRKAQGVSPISFSIGPLWGSIHHVVARFREAAAAGLIICPSYFAAAISWVALELRRSTLWNAWSASGASGSS